MAGLRPDDTRAAQHVAAFSLFGMMNWIYTWYHPERDVPVDQLVEEMTSIFLEGYPQSAHADVTVRTEAGTRPSIWRR
jgi:hypothetical protein